MTVLRPDKIIKDIKPLYFHNSILYCSNYDKIIISNDFGESFKQIGRLRNDNKLKYVIKHSSLLQRIMRASVYRMRVLSNGNLILTFRKGVYCLKPDHEIAELTFRIKSGSRPTSLSHKPNGLIVFGDYWDNPCRGNMFIHGSIDNGENWEPVYRFKAGSIRHIHGITYDKWDDCFWICTGDHGKECKLLKADSNFSNIEVISEGGQINRFYSITVMKNKIIMATDTPLKKNYILSLDKDTKEIKNLQSIENSSFYACQVKNLLFLSTLAEPSTINDTKQCHLWVNDVKDEDWERILSLDIDFIQKLGIFLKIRPKGFFQFPRIFFPEGKNPSNYLFCYGTGVRDYDNKLFRYDLSKHYTFT